ncbi:hypothetical protein EGW08_006870 [Elysia chlorotica]|uniref:Fibronectin type III-like domain-containing protein n=1 Tax=Elysia chlorotica TaxID=188477 RepID=A0A433TV01_ELYCH|nr:hypothetical protein EGW08_006870 [Elysia chlorotica]
MPSSSSYYFGDFTYPFQNPDLPWDARVDDLVSRLTLEEIQLQMARGGQWAYSTPAPAIPRLGIGPYVWNSNCHRGDQQVAENATAFPQSIGLAASFSPQVLFDVGTAASIETRGKHNDFVRRGVYATHTGASCFSPVINVARDPRWGRVQETYGEDPYMSGELAANFLRGLHGDHPRFVRVTGGCLHVDAYSGPDNVPVRRFSFNANAKEDLHMTFLPGFKRCVQAGTFSFMCSYNSINGVPACANKKILTDVLRQDWKFRGYVVSDEGAIEYLLTDHKYVTSMVDAAAAGVQAGCNLELSDNLVQPAYLSIVDAVKQGKLNESLVRERVKPLFYTRMRLGQFDPPENNPFSRLNSSVVETPEHQAKAVEVAAKSFVLLKNLNNALPLVPSKYSHVAVIGPMADEYDQIFGNLPPIQDRSFSKTPLEGLQDVFKYIHFNRVCKARSKCVSYNATLARDTIKDKELIIAIFGTGQLVEKEANDRHDTNMPGKQQELLQDIMNNKGGAKLVLILMNAGPLNVTFADESSKVDAILECFFPGQATGEAIKKVITNEGGKWSPAGRLPTTWYKYADQIPPMVNYSMQGRTYRYLTSDPLYPFGYGLSYSTFVYSSLKLKTPAIEARQNLSVSISVQNTGLVIQCYIKWTDQTLPVPIQQLAYFNRVHLKAKQTLVHSMTISWERWAFWQDGEWAIKAGSMVLACGGQQPNQKKKVPSNVISTQFKILSSMTFDDSL